MAKCSWCHTPCSSSFCYNCLNNYSSLPDDIDDDRALRYKLRHGLIDPEILTDRYKWKSIRPILPLDYFRFIYYERCGRYSTGPRHIIAINTRLDYKL